MQLRPLVDTLATNWDKIRQGLGPRFSAFCDELSRLIPDRFEDLSEEAQRNLYRDLDRLLNSQPVVASILGRLLPESAVPGGEGSGSELRSIGSAHDLRRPTEPVSGPANHASLERLRELATTGPAGAAPGADGLAASAGSRHTSKERSQTRGPSDP